MSPSVKLPTPVLSRVPCALTLPPAGLSLLNISLDTLRPERFVAMTRRQGHDRVLASIHQAAALGFDPVKVNVVVMRGVNDDEVADFVELTREHPINVSWGWGLMEIWWAG